MERKAAEVDSRSAEQLFQELAMELEEGHGDPERFFRAHPEHEEELRRLHRAWCRADDLFRDLAADRSLLHRVGTELRQAEDERHLEAILARLAAVSYRERYEIRGELGRGGMGVVERAFDRVLGRELALKRMRCFPAERRARFLRRFVSEAEVLASLDHPSIVAIHDLGLDGEGRIFLAMPLLQGLSLDQVLARVREQREGWSTSRVLDVLIKICDAVAYAHERGVLHRDLKPSNVIVGRFGEVYVLDWGLARVQEDEAEPGSASPAEPGALTLSGEVLGTPAYMAPEQTRANGGNVDTRVDVYAIGAILYELLSGARPYGERSSHEALAALVAGPPRAIDLAAPMASEELRAIVRRAMQRDPARRYPSAAALGADLVAFRDGRVVTAHRTGALIEARKWIARNRALAAALAAVMLVLVLGLATSLVLLRRAEDEKRKVFRLALTRNLEDLEERALLLWPAVPAQLEALRAWQRVAQQLFAQLEPSVDAAEPDLRAQLAELERERAHWTTEDRWWHGELERLVDGIEALADPQSGLYGVGCGPHGFGIGWRIAAAERLREREQLEETRALWSALRARVRATPRYGGLELAPQSALLPLGPDPRSGLEEFAHLLSGEAPARDASGNLVLDEQSALVLVLVPAVSSWMGSQTEDPEAPNFAAVVETNELPLHRRALDAHFLGKHELSQAQWRRLTGTSPSFHSALPESPRLPVDSLTWHTARAALQRAGLRLPLEPEWEHACRAGSDSVYPWGSDPLAFARHANIKDESTGRETPGTQRFLRSPVARQAPVLEAHSNVSDHLPAADGFAGPAPIGSFEPNAFGFHDMIGNVWEWCEERFAPYPGANEPTFLTAFPAQETRVLRGGAYNRTELRSAARGREVPEFAYQNTGTRAARSIER